MNKICIIEDNKDISDFIRERLSLDNNMHVAAYVSGLMALRNIKLNKPDLIILDLGLEDIRGENICKEIKETYPDLPIIILTGEQEKEKMLDLFNLGASDYVTKPFDVEVLIARINAQLRKTSDEPTTHELKADGLSINLETYTVEREGKPIELTAKEFDLLKYMVLNKNILLSRDKILNSIWGFNNEIETRVVDVHIGKLRKKVDNDFPKKLIHSMRGFGYKLVSDD